MSPDQQAKPAPSFRFVDLFAGIGGFHLALQQLGGECVMASEKDPDAARVYAENHGIAPLGDIREIDPADVPDHDVLAAGFPCQAFSKAGSQHGLRDRTRGTLFFDLAEIVAVKKPRFLVLENVRNLARHDDGRTWKIILARLRELGYRVSETPNIMSPHLLPPRMGGAPQFRERVFILAELADSSSDPLASLTEGVRVERSRIGGWQPRDWDLKRWLDSHPPRENDLSRFMLREHEITYLDAWSDFVKRIGVKLPGFPLWEWSFTEEPDLSDAHPDWKKIFHRKNSIFYKTHHRAIDEWRQEYDLESFPSSYRKFEWQAQDWSGDPRDLLIQFRPSGIRVKQPTHTPALVAITQTPILGWSRRRMTPSEAASLQGLPSDFKLHPTPALAYKQLGNAVNVGVAKFMASALFRTSGWNAWSPQIASATDEEPMRQVALA